MNTGVANTAAGQGGASAMPQALPFVIPVTASLQEGRARTLKHGDTFAVFDQNGDAVAGPGRSGGIYHYDTRHLSHWLLMINGGCPILLSSVLRDDNATLTCDLTNPDLFDETGALVLVHDVIHIRRSRFLWQATCYERLALRNFDDTLHRIRLELTFAADFADVFEVRGTRRHRHGCPQPANVSTQGVTLAYLGADGRHRATRLCFDPAPTHLSEGRGVFDIELAPRQTRLLYIEIRCDGARADVLPSRPAFVAALRTARRALRASSSRATAIVTSNEIFNEAVRRSVSDLYMLVTETPQGPYPYAGIPWFSTFFGRDALITALETLWLDPAIARGVLGFLAAHQATQFDAEADAEPGKILHEIRQGEMANLGEVPFRRYYGSIDATPLFIMLAGAYLERTGDLATIQTLWPHLEAALAWISQYGDRDGDGFVEYDRHARCGLANQGWKDSHDAVFHADGSRARGPIALVEVQAYVYGAWRAAAHIAARLGHMAHAATLERKAQELRQHFDESFFDKSLGTYVLALDGSKRPCRVRTSNAGHALYTGIACPERAATVAASLMASPSFSGWGVRTVASTEARYNPMSYHNGSVWPHDNAIVAAGLVRYGLCAEATRIFEGLFAASTYVDLRRLPELFCGFGRQRSRGPTLYPVACAPQAWAAAAPLSLIQSCLNLSFDVAAKQVIFCRPLLPAFLDSVTLRGLRIGDASIDVALRRAGDGVTANVIERQGQIGITTTG